MANPEHLKILKQGVKVWNDWREKNPVIMPDLSEADFTRTDLSGAHLRDADLSGADLSGAHLYGANLSEANLSGTNLNVATLVGADLSEAHLSEADLSNAHLSGADLSGAHLRDADLSGADLFRANLRDANLRDADLSRAVLSRATLCGANLSEADLYNADLSGADLSVASIGWTIFANLDLSTVKGLEKVAHIGPSTIGIDTIYKSRGNIPEVFLRKAGVPENFITYMRSLTGTALDFYKCFISFTEADDLFSERLYNDLQGAGVRCWRWKEDARWGKNLMSSIDDAVRIYDKLVVICSEQSLKAPAVIREIERALQKEDEQARQGKEGEVLFPLRLDDYVFNGWNHHRKADLIAKNIGDFRQWHEPEHYKKAFDRLLRDLKAGE